MKSIFCALLLLTASGTNADTNEEDIIKIIILLNNSHPETIGNCWYPEYAKEKLDWIFSSFDNNSVELEIIYLSESPPIWIMSASLDPSPRIFISMDYINLEIADMKEGVISPDYLQNLFLISIIHEAEHLTWPQNEFDCKNIKSEEARTWYVVNELLVSPMIELGMEVPEVFMEADCLIRSYGPKSPEFQEFIEGRYICP